jgi:hypothetical protein
MRAPLLAAMVATLVLADVAAPAPAQGGVRAAPFYADPLFDASHDAEFIWHAGEQCWWMSYLQVLTINTYLILVYKCSLIDP